MGSVNLTTIANLYKHLYRDGPTVSVYEDSNFFASLGKVDDFEGDQYESVVIYGGTGGAGSFSLSQNKKSAPPTKKFVVTRGEDYHHISISNLAMAASRSKKGALREAMKVGVDGAAYGVSRSMANQLWGTGTARRGVIATSGISGSTITLATTQDVTKFEVGDEIVTSASDAYGSAVAGVHTITNIDPGTGILTVAVAVATTAPAAAAGDSIFRYGETTPFTGVFGWCPKADVTVTSASFFGVDRTAHVARLAGTRVDGGGANMEDVIFEMVAQNRSNGGRGTRLWMNTFDFARFQKECSSKTWIDIKTDNAKFGLRAIGFATSSGDVAVMEDKDCPQGHAILMNPETLKFHHLRGLPHLADEDGKKFRMETGADNITGWYRCWGNLVSTKPVDLTSGKW